MRADLPNPEGQESILPHRRAGELCCTQALVAKSICPPMLIAATGKQMVLRLEVVLWKYSSLLSRTEQ